MAVSTTIGVNVVAILAKALDLAAGGAMQVPQSKSVTYALATGTGANQADRVWSDTRTTSGTDSLDLNGVLADALGDPFSLLRIKYLVVVAAGANTADIRVARPAANGVLIFGAASDYVTVPKGGCFVWVAPDATAVPVTAGSSDGLEIISAGGSQTYDIIVGGASA